MKKLLWKIEYAFCLRKLTHTPLRWGFENAGAFIESFGEDWKDTTPQEAAQWERDEMLSSC